MKLLLIFLVCVAAANAYSVVSQASAVVYPSTSTYRYRIYFPSTWCSSSYYSSILKVYPGETCGTDGWEERSISEISTEVESHLKNALGEMTKDVFAKRDEWIKSIDRIHNQYKDNYERFLNTFYSNRLRSGLIDSDDVSEKEAKLLAYSQKLNDAKSEYVEQYNQAIATKFKTVTDYHKDLVKRTTQCLNTRQNKIAEYKQSIAQKIKDNSAKFAEHLLEITVKKQSYYRSLLQNVYSGTVPNWIEFFKIKIALNKYGKKEIKKVEGLVRDYVAKLVESQKKLVSSYACSYQCSLSDGHLRFNQRSYYNMKRTVKSIATNTYSYGVTPYNIKSFEFSFQRHNLEKLKTCDVDAAAGSVTNIVDDMKKQMETTIDEESTRFTDWKAKWENYHDQYRAKFAEIVRNRHSWWIDQMRERFNNNNAALDNLRRNLQQRKTSTYDNYDEQLKRQISNAVTHHTQQQARYKKSVEDQISRIETTFNDCATRRSAAIAAYKKKLESESNKHKMALIKEAEEAKSAQSQKFDNMMMHFHGDYKSSAILRTIVSCYNEYLSGKLERVRGEIVSYWNDYTSRLVQHYECNYTCRVRASGMPSYHSGSYYRWIYRLPDASSYQFRNAEYRQYAN